MDSNKRYFLSAVLALLCACGTLGAQDILEPGETLYLQGNLAGAANYFSAIFRDNPGDILAKHLLANCLIVSGKDALKARRYAEGRALLDKARALLPRRRDLRSLCLLAEMEDRYRTGGDGIPAGLLDTAKENAVVFDVIFAGAPFFDLPGIEDDERFVIHKTVDGETLATIAMKYYKDYEKWQRIWKANPRLKNPHRVFPGTQLVIPLP